MKAENEALIDLDGELGAIADTANRLREVLGVHPISVERVRYHVGELQGQLLALGDALLEWALERERQSAS